MSISSNILSLRQQVATACELAKCDPASIQVEVAGKYATADQLQEVVDAGLTLIGENRVQAAQEKVAHVRGATWHMIGHLQSNKVKKAIQLFQMVESIDSVKLAKVFAYELSQVGKTMEVLIEVNVSREINKAGLPDESLYHAMKEIVDLPHVRVVGLMTMPPFTEDAEASRKHFVKLRTLRDKMQRKFDILLPHLSMGTSQDFGVAIEEGATIIRVGRSIFGGIA